MVSDDSVSFTAFFFLMFPSFGACEGPPYPFTSPGYAVDCLMQLTACLSE